MNKKKSAPPPKGRGAKEGGSSKKAFDFPRGNMHVVDPFDLVIDGGKGILPKEESGPHDTPMRADLSIDDRNRLSTPLDPQFSESIYLRGVFTPVTIVKIGDRAVVLEGKRRVRGARRETLRRARAGEPPIRVPCVVQHDRSKLALLSTLILGNNGRSDDTLSDKIMKLKSLLGVGSDHAYAATMFNVGEDRIQIWLDYDLYATEELRAVVDTGAIAASAGFEIAKVHDPDRQRATLAKLVGGSVGKPSTRGARALVQASAQASDGDRPVSARTRVAQRALLTYLHEPPSGDPLVKQGDSKSWWAGVAAALRLVVGKGDPDPRLTGALKQAMGVAEAEGEAEDGEADDEAETSS